jgi:hypothetical protein
MATFSSLRPGKILGRNTLDIPILKPLNSLEIDRKREIVTKRPVLISKEEYDVIKPEINIVQFDSFTPVSTEPDPLSGLEVDTKSFSPRLLNWIEPYFIRGLRKTLFYTEVNSGLKAGDRVFIIGGNYDNNNLIEIDKYKRDRDGYKVLLVDKCQIVLDIDYTGDLPFKNESIDNFIKVQYVSDESDFLNVNKQFTTRGGQFNYKFSQNQNNVIFTDIDFTNTSFYQSGFGSNRGLTSSPGFFIRDDQNSFGNGTYSWINVSSTIMSGTFSNISSLTYSINDRIKILGRSFNYNGQEFKEGYIYKWNIGPTQSSWIPDVIYNQPIISKSNFRSGNFKGKFNSGIYGTPNKKISWNQNNAVFNGGTILNTLFESGLIDSKYTLSETYTTEFDENGLPNQKITPPNNGGRGYNFILDTDLITSIVNNASVYGSNFGTESSSFSTVENSILATYSNFSNNIKGGYFENCKFNNSSINKSELRTSKVSNSLSDNIKSINSNFKDSIITKSTYLSDSIIKITDYDEFIISEDKTINSTFSNTFDSTHKVYKFYINESSFNRLKLSDNFYIRGLKVNDGTNNLITYFDKKFKLGSYVEYFDDLDSSDNFYKRGQRIDCFLSSPEDNDWIYTSVFTTTSNYYTKTLSQNNKKGYSIDVVVNLRDLNNILISGLQFNYDTSSTPDISLTSSNIFLGNIIDISNAYIIESNFESGIFQNSDWVSGRNIEYNFNNNITVNTNAGGFYNLSIITQSSTIVSTTSYLLNSDESSDFVYKTGSVVFLNSVYYDTTGKVDGVLILTPGNGYLSSTGLTTSGGSGNGLVMDITATDIGSVLSITISNGGTLYPNGTFNTTYGGTGSGLTLDITTNMSSNVIVATISNPGIGYSIGDVVTINSGNFDATVTIESITNGEVISATISLGGIGYNIGDSILISGGNGNSSIQVTSITGSLTRLPDSYKVISNNNGQIYLQEVGNSGIFQNLLEGGLFYTPDLNNRWGYIHRSKITKSKIKSGIFRRTYIYDSLIENSDFVVDDYDFQNYDRVKSLVLVDGLFKDNKNLMSKATYLHSNFTIGSDNWINGIIYESTWNGGTFSRGLFKKSSWDSGLFQSGRFYLSRSFNAIPTIDYPYYDVNNIKTYWRSGLTTATISNNRHSWRSGSFISGEFVKSDWESGELKGGSFYNSKWYSGTMSGGIFGKNSIPSYETRIFNANVKYTTVENADFYAGDSSLYGLSSSSIIWESGIFNDGEFGTDVLQSTASHVAIWEDGVFNGGEVVSNAVWKNGIFNGGKFISGYNWTFSSPDITNISSSASDYAWQNGEFNRGEFGNGEYGTNSTWFDGKFNGGEFKGRIWQNGILTNGTFMGGSTISAVGGYSIDGMTESNASIFVDSFTNSFYGLWNNGVVSPVIDEYITDLRVYDAVVSVREKIQSKPKTFIKNALWLGGKFNHGNAVFQNSIWLDGEFSKGTFDSSSFNPWVRRLGSPSQSFNLNDDLITGSGSCIWNNGVLQNSDFYISQWKKGRFLSGTAFGMIWKDGVSNYMNAFNICWNNGVWRNGNWYGSYFQYDGSINDPFNRQILFRVMNCTGTSSLHLWNVFTGNATNTSNIVSVIASTPSFALIQGPGQDFGEFFGP